MFHFNVSTVTALEQFNSYWGRSDDGTYSTRKLCLFDCAAACAAESACKAFATHQSMCKLKSTAFLRTHCKRFECDLIYIKKKYSSKCLAILIAFIFRLGDSCCCQQLPGDYY